MGKALKKKQRIEAEKQLSYIATLHDKQKTAESSAKFKKQEKKSLLDLPEFMLNNPEAINSIENFKSNTHSIEKRAKDAITFMYGRYAIKKLFLDLFYKTQCICKGYKDNDERLNAVSYSLEFFGKLIISLGVGISTKSMLQKYLSKREIAVFNTLSGPLEYTSIFELFIYCKCAARDIEKGICDIIVSKLREVYKHGNTPRYNYGWRGNRTITWDENFLNITEKKNFFVYEGICRLVEFLGAWKDKLNPHILGDILDFLISRKFEFNYKGRTFNSLVGCVINWHMELNRLENEKNRQTKTHFQNYIRAVLSATGSARIMRTAAKSHAVRSAHTKRFARKAGNSITVLPAITAYAAAAAVLSIPSESMTKRKA